MPAISVEEVKQNLQAILEKVAKGEEVAIVQEGKILARIVPPLSKDLRLARRKAFRNSINLKGKPMSQTVLNLREKSRY